ncbi:hypothetical protein Tco_1421182 [Tanacetum coccineum]
MSTLVFVDPKISTKADKAQSSRVPVPLPEDPYEAIRQAYLDGTDIESEPTKDPVETETPESPLTVAPPTSLLESTPPNLVPILCRTAHMAACVPPAMSSGLSASMAEVEAMSESAFSKRFRSSYKSLPSLSPPDLPSWKCYQGTSELIEDGEEDDDEEHEEIEESLDSDSVSEDAEDEGPTAEDEDLAARNKGLAVGDEDPQAVLVVGTAVSAPLGLGYGALRRRELVLEEDHVYSTFEVGQGSRSAPESERPERVSASRHPTLTTWTDPEDGMVYIDVDAYPPPAPPVQTPPSPEWTSGLLPISLSLSVVSSPISSPMIPLTEGLIHDHAVRLEELLPALFERYDRDIGELFTRSEAVRDEIFSQRYRFRSLEHEQERVAVTFGALWRPVLALKSWAGQADEQRATLWHAISDTQEENRELWLQLAKERRVRLELAKIVDSMWRGQDSRGDV